MIDPGPAHPFTLTGRLDGGSPLIIASPHSGTILPDAFRRSVQLPLSSIRQIEDSHVDRLLAGIDSAPVLAATVSRAVIDLNRAPDEYDPAMLDGPFNPAPRSTERVRRGHGLFPRVVSGGRAIHHGRIPAATARHWLESFHQPWHTALEQGLAAARQRYGHAILLDMHSMPPLDGDNRPQIVLGDCHGTSAAPQLVDQVQRHFLASGFRVGRNSPYAGGYTTSHHGRPQDGVHALQIELDRSLYMNPQTFELHDGFVSLASCLVALARALAATDIDLWPPASSAALAAE